MKKLAHGVGAVCVLLASQAWAADDGRVPVKISGGHDWVLERMIEGTTLWESLCVGACNTRVPWTGWYRVTGRGTRPSLPIGLVTASDGVAHIDPHPAYSSGFVGGILTSAIGAVVFFGGAIAIAAYNPSPPQFDEPPCGFGGVCGGNTAPLLNPNSVYVAAGLAMVIGGTMSLAGILVAILSHHTRVSQPLTVSGRSLTLTF